MPCYEYWCESCVKSYEVKKRVSDPVLENCPVCGREMVKLVSLSNFSLKGGGWAKDGYSSASKKKS